MQRKNHTFQDILLATSSDFQWIQENSIDDKLKLIDDRKNLLHKIEHFKYKFSINVNE